MFYLRSFKLLPSEIIETYFCFKRLQTLHRHFLLVWNGLFGEIGGEAPPIITIGWPLLTILVLVGFRYVWNGLCGGSKFLAWYLPLDMVHVRAKDTPTNNNNIRSAQIYFVFFPKWLCTHYVICKRWLLKMNFNYNLTLYRKVSFVIISVICHLIFNVTLFFLIHVLIDIAIWRHSKLLLPGLYLLSFIS